MRFLNCKHSPNFYVAKNLSKVDLKWLLGQKPEHRFFEDGSWYVHYSLCFNLAKLHTETTGTVDYSELCDSLKERISLDHQNWKKAAVVKPTLDKVSAARTLYVSSDAPEIVVKAAYRALAKQHHPDSGGDPETFKQITEAYERLKG